MLMLNVTLDAEAVVLHVPPVTPLDVPQHQHVF